MGTPHGNRTEDEFDRLTTSEALIIHELQMLREYAQGEFGRVSDRMNTLDRSVAVLTDRYAESQDALREYLDGIIAEQREEEKARMARLDRCLSVAEGAIGRVTSKPVLMLVALGVIVLIAGGTGMGVAIGDWFSTTPVRTEGR